MEIQDKVIKEVRGSLGLITLNRPSKLNVLDEEMIDLMTSALESFKENDLVKRVMILANGSKAFCAGGDVVSVVKGIEQGRDINFFFEKEYSFDKSLYQYPKPIITFAHGIVFGGGLGIFSGGSTRICSQGALFSMPEVTIGFFPDVASSYFLQRIPKRWRLFMGLCGARVKDTWAFKIGLIDAIVENSCREELIGACSGQNEVDPLSSFFLDDVLDNEFNLINEALAPLDTLKSVEEFHSWAQEIKKSSSSHSYLLSSLESYFQGSRLSSAVTWLLYSWCSGKGLEECFALDSRLSVLFGSSYDFREGVRALLIDKDKCPKFQFSDYNSLENTLSEHYKPLFLNA